MRQLSRIHVGNSKTDVRDAYVIAHAGLNLRMPCVVLTAWRTSYSN